MGFVDVVMISHDLMSIYRKYTEWLKAPCSDH